MSEDQIYCFNLLNNTNKSKIMLDVKNKSHEQIEDCGTIWDVHQIHRKKKRNCAIQVISRCIIFCKLKGFLQFSILELFFYLKS